MYYISVDCGGTKTAFLLTNEKGEVKGKENLGPANYLVTGLKESIALINDGVTSLLNQANINQDEVAYGVFALAGFGHIEADIPLILEEGKKYFTFKHYFCNDVENALMGSLLGKQGIHLIAGTGSIGMGSDGEKVKNRAGGWGWYCGADEGGGYWIGSNLLRAFEKQADGRAEKTKIYSYMYEKFGFKTDSDCLDLIINKLENRRDKIAALAKNCAELCDMGDPVALEIMKQAGYELGKVARAIFENETYQTPITISYSGSVWMSRKYLKPGIEEALKGIDYELRSPVMQPLPGGIALAMKLDNYKFDEETISNLGEIGKWQD